MTEDTQKTEEQLAEERNAKLEKQKAAQEEADEAKAKAAEARAKVEEARVEATKADVKPEVQAYYDAVDEADKADAEAAEAQRKADSMYVETDEKHPLAGGNIPANPKDAGGILEDDKGAVHLSRQNADGKLIHTSCAKEMTGDYVRAGWNVDPTPPHEDDDGDGDHPHATSKKSKKKAAEPV